MQMKLLTTGEGGGGDICIGRFTLGDRSLKVIGADKANDR